MSPTLARARALNICKAWLRHRRLGPPACSGGAGLRHPRWHDGHDLFYANCCHKYMRGACNDNACRHRHFSRQTYVEEFTRIVGNADAECDWYREDHRPAILAVPMDEFTRLLVTNPEALLLSMRRTQLVQRDEDLQTYLSYVELHVQARRGQPVRRLLISEDSILVVGGWSCVQCFPAKSSGRAGHNSS